MGYRSNVRITVSKDGFKKLRELVRDSAARSGRDWNLIDTYSTVLANNDQMRVCINDVKWYTGCPGYEDVNDVEDALRELRTLGYGYHFARIGENYTDIEEEYYEGEEDTYIDWAYIIREFDDESDGFKECGLNE